MAAPVQITKASELHTDTGQTEGMIRQGAIIDKSDNISASGLFPCKFSYYAKIGSVLQS